MRRAEDKAQRERFRRLNEAACRENETIYHDGGTNTLTGILLCVAIVLGFLSLAIGALAEWLP